MLTVDEIKNVSFRKANIGGYKPEDVDSFIDEVIASFEQLKKEKTNLVHKIDVLATRVEQYRADEETVRNALLASQKVSDACIREAKEKAAKIVRDAETKAQALLVDANKTTALQKENYLQLQADAVELRTELINLYKKHIKNIDELPTSAELDSKKESLDEKYPTEPIANTAPEEEPVKEEEVAPVAETPAEEEPQAETAPVKEAEIPQKKAPKHTSKFNGLKFGDNYDVSAE